MATLRKVIVVVLSCLKVVLRQLSYVVALVVLNKRQPTTYFLPLFIGIATTSCREDNLWTPTR